MCTDIAEALADADSYKQSEDHFQNKPKKKDISGYFAGENLSLKTKPNQKSSQLF